jgi:hydrogenase/urease accessory protein HupE
VSRAPTESALTRGIAWGGAVGALLFVLGSAHGAAAHTFDSRFGDLYGGVLHPLTALEHALPILAVGLLAGQQGERAARWLVLVFPLALLCGAALAVAVPPLSVARFVNAASFVVLGLLLAAGWRLPLGLLIALGAAFGLTHGYENGRAMAPDTTVHLFVLGVAAAGGLVTALVSAAAIDLAPAPWSRVAVRVAGSWIAAIGIMTIGLA